METTWLLTWSGPGDWAERVRAATDEADAKHLEAGHVLSRAIGSDDWSLLLDRYEAAERDAVVDALRPWWANGSVRSVGPAAESVPLHPVAASGFGSAAEAYERGRPDYPAAAIADLVSRLSIGPGTTVLDLAAGTGKLTRDLVPTGAEVIAVEPIDAMAALLARAVPTARLLRGTAEAIPVPDHSVDVVTVAQAFHWFEPHAAAAELRRVLRRRGAVAALWNTRRIDLEPWASVDRITAPYDGRTPHYRNDDSWQAALEAAGFGPLVRTEYDHAQTMDRAGFIDRVMSTSYLGALPDDEADAVRGHLGGVVADADEVLLRYRTDVFVCHAP